LNNFFLEKGRHVYLSEVGHRGFLYPESSETVVLYSSNCEMLPWVGSNTKKAILVPENSVSVAGSPNKKIPVWVKNG